MENTGEITPKPESSEQRQERVSFSDLYKKVQDIRRKQGFSPTDAQMAEMESEIRERVSRLQAEANRELETRKVRETLERLRDEEWGGLGEVEPIKDSMFGVEYRPGFRLVYRPDLKLRVSHLVEERVRPDLGIDYIDQPRDEDVETSLRVAYRSSLSGSEPAIDIQDSTYPDEFLGLMYNDHPHDSRLQYYGTHLSIKDIPASKELLQHEFDGAMKAHVEIRRKRHQTPQEIKQLCDSWKNAPLWRRIINPYKPIARELREEAKSTREPIWWEDIKQNPGDIGEQGQVK